MASKTILHVIMRNLPEGFKEKERLDAQIAVATPGGNAGQKQMDDYNRTYDQDHNYSEITSIAERIAALEEQIKSYMTEE